MNFMSAAMNKPSPEEEEEEEEEREHMFDKVVTPSDVGKLNRLVIPKQHAERYFPLDAAAHDKGLLLNFEDRNGKPWRFRYSYWNSSQSYVMTKGWSRFVKEKKLDAGDIVSFHRGKDRLFIDWRRRPPDRILPDFSSSAFHHRSWPPLFLPPSRPRPTEYSRFLTPHHPPYANNNYSVINGNPCPPPSIMYLRSGSEPQQFGGGGQTTVFNAVPVVQGKAAAKRLRLFGVNMDCPINDDILTSTTLSHHPPISLQFHPPVTSPPLPFYDYSSPSSSAIPRPDDKGKGSMSLDFDI